MIKYSLASFFFFVFIFIALQCFLIAIKLFKWNSFFINKSERIMQIVNLRTSLTRFNVDKARGV